MNNAYQICNGAVAGRELPDTGICINTAEIPSYVGDSLAAATMDLIYTILRQPGGREALDARTAARHAAQAARRKEHSL